MKQCQRHYRCLPCARRRLQHDLITSRKAGRQFIQNLVDGKVVNFGRQHGAIVAEPEMAGY